MTRSTKSSRPKKKRRSRVRGAGYMTGPQWVSPGDLVYNSYSGPQTNFSPLKDCTGNPMSHRTGYIADYTPRGLPYGTPWKGGKRGRKRGGAAMPPPAPFMADFKQTQAPPINGSLTYPPSTFPDRTGGDAAVVAPEVVASRPGNASPPGAVIAPGASTQVIPPKQSGGRWTSLFGPLNEESGIGTTPGQFGRFPCEAGTYNPLNRNPGNIQELTTAPLTPPYVTMSPMNTMRGMRGGSADMNLAGAPIQLGSGADFSRANFPMVDVGSRDAMRYYAPTAGYGHDFQTFKAPSPVPALMLNTGYDARAFNPACIKTGGSRKNKRRFRGGDPVALNAGSFRSLQPGEAETRRDFDGSNNALPSQAAGSRKKRRSRTRRTRRTRRSRSRHTRRK